MSGGPELMMVGRADGGGGGSPGLIPYWLKLVPRARLGLEGLLPDIHVLIALFPCKKE
jgi:hypothetical protein